ncbi:hypothetical protein GGR51DRAFT_188662 [Nemania sp. FL0031]|nr:hypothetical protein GGR51DRAFT_188662 [Nemania sp. FL0031]
MADSASPTRGPPSPAAQPGVKRRKLRKGTRSCWECKRRKNKCTWSSSEGKCDGCRHRDTRCIGQEFPEERVRHERRKIDKSDDERIQRLEALVEELSRKVDSGNVCEDHIQSLADDGGDELQASSRRSPSPSAASHMVDPWWHEGGNALIGDDRMNTISVLLSSPPRRMLASSPSRQFEGATDELITPLVHALVAAWPNRHHHDAILDSTVAWLHPALSAACSGFRTPPSPKDLLQLPPPGTAPVAIARKLLALGAYIQVVSSRSGHETTSLSSEYRTIPSRLFDTVSKLVTHNDSLPESIEIVECLITESQYHNYMGNIRRSWIVLRRAMAMAQILGLDRQNKILAHNSSADKAEEISRQENVWFLLVHFDQYLSLLLGISPSPAENSQTTPGLLERCTPSERMGRLHSMAAGRILQRNRVDMYNLVETQEIDKILQKAAACMPAQWWSPPDWSDGCGDEGVSSVINRLMVHFAHYNILLQAHLPYMIRCLGTKQYYSSTPTAVNCCREILTRFTAFRSRHPAVSYCRGLDIFTFVASITLCLLHIYASSESDVPSSSVSLSISSLVAPQRFTHRGLMERALHSIEMIAQVEPEDTISSGIVPVFRRLLVVEDESYRGINYTIHLPPHAGQSGHSSRNVMNTSDTLSLDVPFCGTIRVEREDVSDTISTEVRDSRETILATNMLPDSFPSFAPGYHMATFPILQASGSLDAMSAGSCQVGNRQLDITNAPTVAPSPDSLPQMPYNDSDNTRESMTASELLMPDLMGILQGHPNQVTDTDLFERLWCVQ